MCCTCPHQRHKVKKHGFWSILYCRRLGTTTLDSRSLRCARHRRRSSAARFLGAVLAAAICSAVAGAGYQAGAPSPSLGPAITHYDFNVSLSQLAPDCFGECGLCCKQLWQENVGFLPRIHKMHPLAWARGGADPSVLLAWLQRRPSSRSMASTTRRSRSSRATSWR